LIDLLLHSNHFYSKSISKNCIEQLQIMSNYYDPSVELVLLPSLPPLSPTQLLLGAWLVCLLVFIAKLLWLSRRKAQLPQVYDDCSAFNCQYKYVGTLRFGEGASGFDGQTSSVLIDLLDARDRFITRLSLPPNWLTKRSHVMPNLFNALHKPIRQIKFQLNRSQQMPDVGSIRFAFFRRRTRTRPKSN
jgi:hypothetical protein